MNQRAAGSKARVPSAYGRRIIVTGHMVNGQFEANPDSLITKCPSKYSGGGSGA